MPLFERCLICHVIWSKVYMVLRSVVFLGNSTEQSIEFHWILFVKCWLNHCVFVQMDGIWLVVWSMLYFSIYGYGSIPINTIFSGMNIHLPAILMFTRGTRFWHTAILGIIIPADFNSIIFQRGRSATNQVWIFMETWQTWLFTRIGSNMLLKSPSLPRLRLSTARAWTRPCGDVKDIDIILYMYYYVLYMILYIYHIYISYHISYGKL